jgi:AraC-like DNA-binding protein
LHRWRLGLLPPFEQLAAESPAPRCGEERRLLHGPTQVDGTERCAASPQRIPPNSPQRSLSGRCDRRGVVDLDRRSVQEGDARGRLSSWTRRFHDVFDRVHLWPAELVLEARLRQSSGQRATFDELAKDLPLRHRYSPASIPRAFKRRFGVTISEYPRSLRAKEAVRMLHETSCLTPDALRRRRTVA